MPVPHLRTQSDIQFSRIITATPSSSYASYASIQNTNAQVLDKKCPPGTDSTLEKSDDRFTSYLSGATSSPTNVDSPEGQTVALQFSLFVHSTFLDGGRTVVAVNEEGVIGAIAARVVEVDLERAAEFHHIVDRDFAQAFKDKGSLDPLDSWHLQLIMTVKEFEGK
ncbi:hypothetical protein MPER_01072, partial [Moniliophthora perniciosa FA553]